MTSTNTPVVRAVRPGDLSELHRINDASTPGVGEVTLGALTELVVMGVATFVAEVDERPAGFILCMTEGLPYESLNYRWLSERHEAFAYCDRIAVDAQHRGKGLGEALYRAAFSHFQGHRGSLLCEVNLAPANPGSLRFHNRLGFTPLGERWSEDRTKGVVYLSRQL